MAQDASEYSGWKPNHMQGASPETGVMLAHEAFDLLEMAVIENMKTL
jgi:hypothetical protein